MNRWIFETSGWKASLLKGEDVLATQEGVRIDDGDKKTNFANGAAIVTSHRLFWSNKSIIQSDLSLPLSLIVFVEEELASGFMKSDKITLHLAMPPPNPPKGPATFSEYNYVKLAFKTGGMRPFMAKIHEALSSRKWEVIAPLRKAPQQPKKIRSGIGGIEKSMAMKAKQTDTEISKAFQDLDALMEMAKPMVNLANTISRKIKEKQGDVSDDETVRFKSYLMSLGISDPVTREACGSSQTYFIQLAREVDKILRAPLTESGGMITLTDAYVRVNRARGLELVSPEDLMMACENLEAAGSSMRLHMFQQTGVKVLQLSSASVLSEDVLKKTEIAVVEAGSLTSEELARLAGVAVVLAKERLLAAEDRGRLCRDDSVEGLRFYPNLFLTKV